MIELGVKEYCNNCKEFEVEQVTSELYYGNEVVRVNCLLKCKHEELCERLLRRIKEELRDDEEDNV